MFVLTAAAFGSVISELKIFGSRHFFAKAAYMGKICGIRLYKPM